MPKFLVERYLPAANAAEVRAAVERMVTAHGPVSHLFTMFVAGEDTALSCFDATNRDAVAQANEIAGFAFDRIVEVTVYPD